MADVNDWVVPGEDDWVVPPKDQSFSAQAKDAAWQLPQGFNKGVDSLVNLPYNIVRGVSHLAGYELPEAKPLLGQFNSGKKPETTTGRYAESVGEAIGASAIPSAGLLAKADKMARLAPVTTPRAIAQTVGESISANPPAAVAADLLASSGSGIGQQAAQDQGLGPVEQTLAGLAGAAAPLAVGTMVGRGVHAVQSAKASSDPYARVAKGLGDQSIDDLADSIAVGATRYDQSINRRALDILGDEMVAAGGDRSIAIPAAIQRLVNDAKIAPATAQDQIRRIARSQADNDLMFGEYPAVAESNAATRKMQPENVTDEMAGAMTNPGTQRLIDYVANTGSLASSQNVRNAIGRRAQELKENTEAAISSMSPSGRTIQDVESMLDAAAAKASAEYKVVHGTPKLVNTAALQNGLENVVQTHTARASSRAGEQADALRSALSEFFVPTPNGRDLVSTLQMAQDARGALRGIIKRNKISGNDHIVNTLQPLYDDVTKVMQKASPRWEKVNREWADLELDDIARDLGDAFSKSAGPKFREQKKQFDSLAPEAKDIVRVHFTQHLLDMIENASKMGGMKNLGELFTKAHIRNMVRDVLGDEAAVKMARLIRDANVMARSRDMLKGSPTQPRQQMQKEQDADLNMLSAVEAFDWGNWRKAIFDNVKAFMRERRNKVIGKVITTPMRDTAAVAENLARMRAALDRANSYTKPVRVPPAIGGYAGALVPPEPVNEVDIATGRIKPYSGAR